ncbi:uncharacterized protein LOC110730316 [Chenopodium quinoa]|uniref:Uncharacterized protein n=1 Tax=Chenopodium quinoa TaxID=63459 RepID=A0A803L339_CHEQI|nr:uncharacterized protein LOC110730316 [Chenopodium quinoa]
MSGFSKLGIILTSVFSILFLSLLAELIYLVWRRRQQARRNTSRIEPACAPTSTPLPTTTSHAELFKLDGIYGAPSRVLFTIKEEEREEVETELASVLGDHGKFGVSLSQHFGNFQLPVGGDAPEVIIMVGEDDDFDVEPDFLTPCTSPPYFTPSPSPTREELDR